MRNNNQWAKLQGSIDSLKASKGKLVKKSLNFKVTKQAEHKVEQVGLKTLDGRNPLCNEKSKINAYGEKIGAYRNVNGEVRQWITIEQAPLDYYKENNPSHYKYCILISKDPDVCVERIIPKTRNDHEVTYALKAFKNGRAHNNYTSTREKT